MSLPRKTAQALLRAWQDYRKQVRDALDVLTDEELKVIAGDFDAFGAMSNVFGEDHDRLVKFTASHLVARRTHRQRAAALGPDKLYCVIHAQDLALCADQHGLKGDDQK